MSLPTDVIAESDAVKFDLNAGSGVAAFRALQRQWSAILDVISG